MVQDGPFLMRDTLNDPSQMLGYTLPVGLVREFLVTSPLKHIILEILGASQAWLVDNLHACTASHLLPYRRRGSRCPRLASDLLPVEPL